MIKFFSLKKDYNLPVVVTQELKAYKYVLNPSYVCLNNINYLAIRVFCSVKKSIVSKLYIWQDGIFEAINLSIYFEKKLELKKVADPKLTIINNQVYCTFNTGYVNTGNNTIGLCVFNKYKIENYYTCSFSNRIRIEKNWAFFHKDNKLHVLYNLNPLTILKEVNTNTTKKEFKLEFKDSNDKTPYSIGTQLVLESKNNYTFIAHKKISRKGKRLYFGKTFTLDCNNSYVLKPSKYFSIHSIKSLFGSKFKFNRNLISCTYFSGLYKLNESEYLVGYGINDTDWRLKKVTKRSLWR